MDGHMTPAVRKKEKATAEVQLTSSFLFSPGPQAKGWCHSHSGWIFFLNESSLETLSQICPELCLLGGSTS